MAQAGKDSLFLEIQRQLKIRHAVSRVAFADKLKKELQPIIQEHFGINVFTCSPEQKTRFRELLVFWGREKRRDNADYWVNEVFNCLPDSDIICVTDVRYENEAQKLKDRGGVLVYVERLNKSFWGWKKQKPANKEEKIHTLPLKSRADYVLSWHNFEQFDNGELQKKTKELISWLKKEHKI